MKYLHILHNDKFIQPYIKFINENFNKKEHKFLIIDGIREKDIKIPFDENIEKYISKGRNFNGIIKKVFLIFQLPILYFKLFNFCKNSEKIYFHGLFDQRIIVFLYLFKRFLNKSTWVVWGGDLYKDFNKKTIFYKMEYFVRNKMKYVSTLVPEDYNEAKYRYNIIGEYKKAIYINPIKLEYLNTLENNKKKEETFIQIGNSADPQNNHIEILKKLSKFKNENIKIYCPLSYGNLSYGKEVEKYGSDIFGEKFICLFKFLTSKEYSKYLSEIDILIFNHKRQQGLFNIFALGYLNKKIYIRDDISTWNYLSNELELKVYNSKVIENETFEEFIKNDENENKEKILNSVYSEKYIKNVWEKNFEL